MGGLKHDGPKNVGDLLRALVGIPGNWTATIIGDGEDRERLLALAQALSVDKRITWAGWQDRPWESVDAVSALVLTSESEGFGMALAEAMARGVACGWSDCRGALAVMRGGVNGWGYPGGSSFALRKSFRGVVDRSGTLG